jgi:hypothetical protein
VRPARRVLALSVLAALVAIAAPARAQSVPGPGELVPQAYRDAVLYTAAGSDVDAGSADARVWPDAMVSLGGDDVLIAQGIAPNGRHYLRLHADGHRSRPTGSDRWPFARGGDGGLALAPDGRLGLLADDGVWQVTLGGTPSPLMRESTSAAVSGIAALATGELLVARANQIVRVAADRSTAVLAGSGRSGHTGDGGPAIAAALGELGVVASLPDGSFVFAEKALDAGWLVRRVDPAGVLTTVAGGGTRETRRRCLPHPASATSVQFGEVADILALPAGDLLIADPGGGVFHVSRAGGLTQIACAVGGPAQDRAATNVDGRRAADLVLADPTSMALTSDGTLLIGASGPDGPFVAMLSPGGRRLGVAVAPETHGTIAHSRVVVTATHAASVAIRVEHRGRTVARADASVPAGRAVLRLDRRVPPGEDTVVVTARAPDGRVAADRLRAILPGPRGLDLADARRHIRRESERAPTANDPTLVGCRAISRQTVTCRLRDDPPDLPVGIRERWTVRRTPDGVMHATVSGEGRFVIQP